MTNDKLKIYRILDANVNRAMEGLRVTEEFARFILDDKKATLTIKSLRNQLKKATGKLPRKELLRARNSLTDVGGKLYTKEEGKRSTLKSVFKSNIKRAEEAIRVLEEFGKLVDPSIGKTFKSIRFNIYELEKRLILRV
ncbi:thiamine-phosphate pyrophosphorylase [Candidatus Saganbacteria bacterium]|nr:thiamine-phosphate pyrophosphorylase [Candidatus Saganbacteria bacterium]